MGVKAWFDKLLGKKTEEAPAASSSSPPAAPPPPAPGAAPDMGASPESGPGESA